MLVNAGAVPVPRIVGARINGHDTPRFPRPFVLEPGKVMMVPFSALALECELPLSIELQSEDGSVVRAHTGGLPPNLPDDLRACTYDHVTGTVVHSRKRAALATSGTQTREDEKLNPAAATGAVPGLLDRGSEGVEVPRR